MDVEKDLYRVSIPMAGGTVAAACLFSYTKIIYLQYVTASVTAFALWIMAALAWTGWKGKRVFVHVHEFWWMMFFLCGICSFATHWMTNFTTVPHSALKPLAEGMGGLIDRIGFADMENNALLRALILGDRSTLSPATKDAFRNAGAAHLLALSGMHLGIIYLIINKAFVIFGNSLTARKFRSAAVIVLTGFYTLLCGAGPSLLRAWLFIALREGSKIIGRPQKAQDIFCVALTLHLVIQPQNASSLGFQLSYLAMVGIVFVWPLIKDWYPGKGIGAKIWQASTLSISCQIFTAPLTYFHFGTFPTYFLITNLVCAPLMSIVMLCGIAGILISALHPASALIPLLEYPLTLLRTLLEIIASM